MYAIRSYYAYGQRDPLVQYKAQASDLFKNLLADIRSALVNRMFTYRPSTRVNTTIDKDRISAVEEQIVPEVQNTETAKSKKKRRRH